jgi:hypothetical protein
LGARFISPVDESARNIDEDIKIADLIICDVSNGDADVMFSLGFAHALSKPIITICRNDSPLPFSIATKKVLIYDPKRLIKIFAQQLKKSIQSAVKDPEAWIYPRGAQQTDVNKHLFISCSHNDKDYLDRLLVHLKPLERENIIDLWLDKKLSAGDKWKTKIEESLRKARVAILLISADFLASDFIVNNELPPLLKAAEAEGTRIIPIIVKPCRFSRDRSLSSFQSINEPKHPLIKMEYYEQEELYNKVSELVESYYLKNN